MNASLVKSSLIIKNLLKERFKELNMKIVNVVKDANEKGNKALNKSNLSLYFGHNIPMYGFPKEEDILWLCIRYQIDIRLISKKLEYNEEKALQELNKYFKKQK